MRSIGSLGDDNSKAYVSGINVDGAKLSETDNGVRIKTYQVIDIDFFFHKHPLYTSLEFAPFVFKLSITTSLLIPGRVRNCQEH